MKEVYRYHPKRVRQYKRFKGENHLTVLECSDMTYATWNKKFYYVLNTPDSHWIDCECPADHVALQVHVDDCVLTDKLIEIYRIEYEDGYLGKILAEDKNHSVYLDDNKICQQSTIHSWNPVSIQNVACIETNKVYLVNRQFLIIDTGSGLIKINNYDAFDGYGDFIGDKWEGATVPYSQGEKYYLECIEEFESTLELIKVLTGLTGVQNMLE